MFTSNPFAELSAFISPAVMQTYVIVMVILVAAGTIYDVLHKKSARYFRRNMQKSRARGSAIGGGEMVSMAIKTAVVDVATSGIASRSPVSIGRPTAGISRKPPSITSSTKSCYC